MFMWLFLLLWPFCFLFFFFFLLILNQKSFIFRLWLRGRLFLFIWRLIEAEGQIVFSTFCLLPWFFESRLEEKLAKSLFKIYSLMNARHWLNELKNDFHLRSNLNKYSYCLSFIIIGSKIIIFYIKRLLSYFCHLFFIYWEEILFSTSFFLFIRIIQMKSTIRDF